MLTKDDELLAALERDPRTAPLDQRARAIADYALKLTRSPQDITVDDIQALRGVGLSDSAIHDASTISAYFNFVNRIASGLGVNVEQER